MKRCPLCGKTYADTYNTCQEDGVRLIKITGSGGQPAGDPEEEELDYDFISLDDDRAGRNRQRREPRQGRQDTERRRTDRSRQDAERRQDRQYHTRQEEDHGGMNRGIVILLAVLITLIVLVIGLRVVSARSGVSLLPGDILTRQNASSQQSQTSASDDQEQTDRGEEPGPDEAGDTSQDGGQSDADTQQTSETDQALTEGSASAGSAVALLDTDQATKDVQAAAGDGTISYAVIDLSTGEMTGSSNWQDGQSASVMIDIPILYALKGAVNADAVHLDSEITFHYEVDGRGKLGQSDDGNTYTLAELLHYMLSYSDNNATNSVLDYLGNSFVNRMCQDGGYTSVNITRKIARTTDYTDTDNYVSAYDLAGMLYEIWNSDNQIDSELIRNDMIISDQTRTEGIGRYLDSEYEGSSSHAYAFLNLNGQKNDKYNEVAVLDCEDGTRDVYGIIFLGNKGTLDDLKDAAAVLGSEVNSVIRQAEANE